MYDGPIRDGVFGKFTDGRIWRCRRCGVEFLPPKEGVASYYESDEYRQDVGEKADVADYFERHDNEQFRKLLLLENVNLRGVTVADIGCAGGSFLDLVKGYASTTIAIDLAAAYHQSLQERGHRTYPNTAAALEQWRGRVDVACAFSVIEHVEFPRRFLTEIRALLTKNGLLLISTPNRNDILLKLGVKSYESFFYRAVHTYYFDAQCLRYTAQQAGFSSFSPCHVHRFNFLNFVQWVQEGKTTGNNDSFPLGSGFDERWKSELELNGLSDYLYAFLKK